MASLGIKAINVAMSFLPKPVRQLVAARMSDAVHGIADRVFILTQAVSRA
jgi:hypothetical protein